ncbi:MAG: tetratricopeptide repeat protein [Anaerolineae bacterium]|nr:tetratricopeptide repeat protein [Gloeobacterales cyanobacterium ES-bin-313]
MAQVKEFYAEGLAKFRSRDYDSARHYFDRALGLEPSNVDILVSRGRLPTYEQGIPDCLAAIAIDPTCADAWALLGYLHWHLQRPNEAIRCCSEAIRLDGRQSWALFTRLKAHAQVGNWQDCLRDTIGLIRMLIKI